MRRSRIAGFAPVVALLAAGCAGGPGDAANLPIRHGPVPPTPSPVAGPAVTGSVRDSAGRIEAGATVVVTVLLTKAERDERNLKSAASLGLGCLDEVGCTSPTKIGLAARNGAFEVPIPSGSYQPDDPIAVTVVAERGPSARVATTVRLQRSAGQVRLDAGRIPIADTAPTVRHAAGRDALVMPRTVASAGPASVVMSRATRESDNQFVQQAPTTDVTGGYDPRLVEDGLVLLDGRQSAGAGGRQYELSASLVVTGTTVPPSRGASCYVEGSRGQRIGQRPCGLTDGILDKEWTPQDDPRCSAGPCRGPQQQHERDVTVVLARAMRVGLLVVRGCGFTCRVAVSADGSAFGSWREAGNDAPAESVFVLRPGSTVRAIRVETATGGFFDGLREVSAFA